MGPRRAGKRPPPQSFDIAVGEDSNEQDVERNDASSSDDAALLPVTGSAAAVELSLPTELPTWQPTYLQPYIPTYIDTYIQRYLDT
jgi:hypothetical protein